jgi:uncharacterized membrane protein
MVQAATATVPPSTAPSFRFDRLDALRGVAVLWMAVFHFCFDLNHFRFIQQNFYSDPFWTLQRTAIVSLFLFCAGMGQAVAFQQGQGWPRFWRRWMQVAGCALLVSLGSLYMFGDRFISFGVLHGMAVMLLIVRLAAPWGRSPWLLWLGGLVALLLPWGFQHPAFDSRWLNWVGLVTHKPLTEDYVPVLPWLGVMLWGLAAGQWVLAHRRQWLTAPLPQVVRPLAVLGRWSLSFYMLHQPVLMGVLMGVAALR